MFALETCDVKFPVKTLSFYYDVTNVEVQCHKGKSEFTLVAVIVALQLISTYPQD